MENKFYAFDEASALAYLNQHPLRSQFFDKDEELRCTDLADGNVNLVFRIQSKNNPNKSIILKQALPFARRYPEFKMPLERARIESDILTEQAKAAPGSVPTLYHFDSELYVNLMEDLREHHIMREGIIKQQRYPNFADAVGTFLARSMFFTSDFYLESAAKKTMAPRFLNPVLCKVTEELVYTFPFTSHETNRYPPALHDEVTALQNDPAVIVGHARCRLDFMTKAECLSHGDLHTGSIMVNDRETKVMDPEFGFYGPFAFDIGMLLGNIAIGFYAQEAHAPSAASIQEYHHILKSYFSGIWNAFRAQFINLCRSEAKAEWQNEIALNAFLENLEVDVLRHAACEMVRRTIGMAHVLELDEIKDEKVLVQVSSKILTAARFFFAQEVRSIQTASDALAV